MGGLLIRGLLIKVEEFVSHLIANILPPLDKVRGFVYIFGRMIIERRLSVEGRNMFRLVYDAGIVHVDRYTFSAEEHLPSL